MKQQIILFTAGLMLSACAGSTPTWGNMSEDDIGSWRDAGVTVNDVQKYMDAKMTSDNVLSWKNNGFVKVENVLAWGKEGFAPEEAKKWRDKNYKLEVAKKWKKNNFSFEDAMEWIGAKFSLEDAKESRAKGLVPN